MRDSFKIAKLEGEIQSMKANSSHSTGKLVTICTLVAAIVGAPGFWGMINPPAYPPPSVSKEDFKGLIDKVDRVASDVTELKVNSSGVNARINSLEKDVGRISVYRGRRVR